MGRKAYCCNLTCDDLENQLENLNIDFRYLLNMFNFHIKPKSQKQMSFALIKTIQ